MSVINISQNLIQHSRTKHTYIQFYFIKKLVEKNIVVLEYTPTNKQLADIFTKSLDNQRFIYFRNIIICIIE